MDIWLLTNCSRIKRRLHVKIMTERGVILCLGDNATTERTDENEYVVSIILHNKTTQKCLKYCNDNNMWEYLTRK